MQFACWSESFLLGRAIPKSNNMKASTSVSRFFVSKISERCAEMAVRHTSPSCLLKPFLPLLWIMEKRNSPVDGGSWHLTATTAEQGCALWIGGWGARLASDASRWTQNFGWMGRAWASRNVSDRRSLRGGTGWGNIVRCAVLALERYLWRWKTSNKFWGHGGRRESNANLSQSNNRKHDAFTPGVKPRDYCRFPFHINGSGVAPSPLLLVFLTGGLPAREVPKQTNKWIN